MRHRQILLGVASWIKELPLKDKPIDLPQLMPMTMTNRNPDRKKSINTSPTWTDHHRPVRVAIAEGSTKSPQTLLKQSLTRARFWSAISARRRIARKLPSDLSIAIKPDLDFFQTCAPTGTSPELVESLIANLFDRGYSNVTVFDGRNVDDSWLHNRTPLCVPDLVGYRFSTEDGLPYDFVGLNSDIDRSTFPQAHPLSKYGISRQWLDADFRIVFAKNKTDEEFAFALGAYNLLALLPEWQLDSSKEAPPPPELCVEILRRVPVDFCIIDAVISNHGPAGSRISCPLHTNTIVASSSLLLADWAAATKMGVDPYASPINAMALRSLGLPEPFAIEGSLAPYPLWRNPHPIALKSAAIGRRYPPVKQLTRCLLQPVDREAFPFRDFPIERINAFLMNRLGDGNAQAAATWWLIAINYILCLIGQVADSANTLYRKNNLKWIELPLQFDYNGYRVEEYEQLRHTLATYEQIVHDVPADRHGNHLRYLDGAILFMGQHTLPVSFAEFIKNVEIHRAIQLMNDYIGGSAMPVKRNKTDLVVHQAERNLYLPQPNWTVLFGGQMIDVEKLETVAYDDSRQKLWWRTVNSPNQSAYLDDGSVEFFRTKDGHTRITIFTYQKFQLPPLLHALRIERFPELHNALVADSYATFFRNTIQNMRLKSQGLPYRIGRNPSDAEQPASGSPSADLSVWLASVVAAFLEMFKNQDDVFRTIRQFFSEQTTSSILQSDELGFHHFNGPNGDTKPFSRWASTIAQESPQFFRDLSDALRKDIAAAARNSVTHK